jgi:LPS-assembly lipoprotein
MSLDHLIPEKKLSIANVSMLRRSLLGLLVTTPVIGIAACGYRLRGTVDLPFTALAITGNPSPPLRADLQTAVLTGTEVKVAINPRDADLILEITNEITGREILAYNANGQISAYRLSIRVGFRAFDTAGVEIVPESEVYITRDMDFSVSTVLANDAQVQAFLGLMRRDLAIQILRRVSASAKAPKTRAF